MAGEPFGVLAPIRNTTRPVRYLPYIEGRAAPEHCLVVVPGGLAGAAAGIPKAFLVDMPIMPVIMLLVMRKGHGVAQ